MFGIEFRQKLGIHELVTDLIYSGHPVVAPFNSFVEVLGVKTDAQATVLLATVCYTIDPVGGFGHLTDDPKPLHASQLVLDLVFHLDGAAPVPVNDRWDMWVSHDVVGISEVTDPVESRSELGGEVVY